MDTTTNFELKVYESTDVFNPLTVENYNTEKIDETLGDINRQSIGNATEVVTGAVHALTLDDARTKYFTFTATGNYNSGDTFTVDGVQVSAVKVDGTSLASGAYYTGSCVLCVLNNTTLTFFGIGGGLITADNSLKFGGELPLFYATSADLEDVEEDVRALGDITLANQTALGGCTIKCLTQAEYDAISVKSATTLYFIKAD